MWGGRLEPLTSKSEIHHYSGWAIFMLKYNIVSFWRKKNSFKYCFLFPLNYISYSLNFKFYNSWYILKILIHRDRKQSRNTIGSGTKTTNEYFFSYSFSIPSLNEDSQSYWNGPLKFPYENFNLIIVNLCFI